MSRKLGNRVPDDFRKKLCAEDLTPLEGRAIVILSVDESGYPHPAMLSYREMASPDETRIRFAMWKGTTTAANIHREPRISMIAVDADMSYYLKGRVTVLREDAETFQGCSVYDFEVAEVLEDKEPQLPISGGIEYHHPEGPEPAEARKAHLVELIG